MEQMQSISMPYGDSGWGYGLGWFIRWHNGRKTVAHSGGQAGVATYALMLPDQCSGVTVITNLSGAKVAEVAEQLAGTLTGKPLYRRLPGDRLPIRTRCAQPDSDERSSFVGTYVFDTASITTFEGDNELIVQAFSPDDPDAQPSALLRVGVDLFLTVQDGSPITFLRDSGGTVDRLLSAGNMYRKQS
jgi:hypothetical protein